MAKNKTLFAFGNLLVAIKALVISLIVAIPAFFIRKIALFIAVDKQMLTFGWLVAILGFVFSLYLWGFLANKSWKWK